MVETYNLSTLLTEEEHNEAIEEAMELESDIQFFNMYMARNKKSKARFNLSFSYGCTGKFFRLVDNGDYSAQKLQRTMMEYKILKKLALQLASGNEVSPYSKSTIMEIYEYFKKEYEIYLEKIVPDFTGCSYTAERLIQKTCEIIQNI